MIAMKCKNIGCGWWIKNDIGEYTIFGNKEEGYQPCYHLPKGGRDWLNDEMTSLRKAKSFCEAHGNAILERRNRNTNTGEHQWII